MVSIALDQITFPQALGGLFLVFFLHQLWKHRDGSAIGTSPRPDILIVPGGIPLLGHVILLVTKQGRMLEYINHWSHVYRNEKRAIAFSMPFFLFINVGKPAQLEYVQKTNFTNYDKGQIQSRTMADILGEGIFATDGEKWNIQRKATSKIFSANNFRGVISSCIEKDVEKLRSILGEHAKSGAVVDLSALFFAFTLSSFTSMAFGLDIGCLGAKEPVPFAVAFDYAQQRINERVFEPTFNITELFTPTGSKMRKAAKVISDFAYDIIDKREAERQAGYPNGAPQDLLTLYMELRDEKGQPLDRKALRDAVVNLIIAGRDTTAQALQWLYFHLMYDNKRVSPIRKEVDEFPVVDYDNFKDMKQTLAAFDEALRLHPSVPKNIKTAVADDQIPGGAFVRKGENVVWSDWAMGRDPDLWGPDAADFDPQRWFDEQGNLKKETVWKSHFFNGGQRLCLGQNLALYEGVKVIAALTKEFDLRFADGYIENVEFIDSPTGEKTPRYAASLTLPMHAPLLATVTQRK